MKNHKQRLLKILCLACCWSIPWFAVAENLHIIATIFPVYDFTRQVAGEDAEVSLLMPPGVEVHHYSPAPSDILKVRQADILFYVSDDMEAWLPDFVRGIQAPSLRVVELWKGNESQFLDAHDADHEEKEDHDEHHDHDPHVWLDPLYAIQLVQTITQTLSDADPDHAAIFQKRAIDYIARLHDLDQRIRSGLAHCDSRTIAYGGHFAFAYFAKRYQLDYWAAYPGFSSDAQPSPKTLAQLIKQVKTSGIRTIFYEEITTPKLAQVLAEETGASLRPLNGVHNVTRKQLDSGVTYLDLMDQNLKNLQEGLPCHP